MIRSTSRRRGLRGVPLLFALALAAAAPSAPLAAQETEGTVIVLVRHAERADDDPRDPNLSAEGLERAAVLARMLADVELTTIWSTDYKRTQQTAGPLAQAAGIEVQAYTPTAEGLAEFAARLRETPGRHLVVGHSNTTPQLVGALGGTPGEPIDEAEYDRLYVLVVGGDGTVTTTLLRFGEAFGG